MGTSASKIHDGNDEVITPGSLPSTPILTPKQKQISDDIIDPRSPSNNIVRTPIQFSSLRDLTREENSRDSFNLHSPAIMKTIIDPRSPTTDFPRTPITVVDNTNLLRKVHKKNLDNWRKTIADVPHQVPPKLLESSPIRAPPAENKRKSFVGLLETNMDFIETDIDVVILNKSLPRPFSPVKSKSLTRVDSISQPESPASIHELSTVTVVECNKPLEKTKTFEEAVKPSEIQVTKVVDDDGLVIDVSKIEITSGPQIPAVEIPKVEVLTETVQEFEKTVNNLIYTEEEHVCTTPPVNKHLLKSGEEGRRIPLGTVNVNKRDVASGKTAPKLRVSDKPRRADYAVSKIPVFKSKNGLQCENTPPKQMDSLRRPKRAQWDNDNTLVI